MKRLFVVGFAIWLVATIVLRIAGQWVLKPDRPVSIMVLLTISGLLLYRLPLLLFSRFAIPTEQRALAGIVRIGIAVAINIKSHVNDGVIDVDVHFAVLFKRYCSMTLPI